MGGEPAHHILGETFYTQLPLRYGHYVAKLQLAPVSPALLALRDAPIELKQDNALREAVAAAGATLPGVTNRCTSRDGLCLHRALSHPPVTRDAARTPAAAPLRHPRVRGAPWVLHRAIFRIMARAETLFMPGILEGKPS